MDKIINEIKEARYEIARSNLEANRKEMVRIGAFVETADLGQCLHLINELIDRVSTLTGEAGSLEDAACTIKKEMACYGG